MKIERLDHLVLTVTDLTVAIQFYEDVMGMQVVRFKEGRYALHFGNQKINLHEYGKEFEPKAAAPAPGTADLCFISSTPLQEIMGELANRGVPIEEGPVQRTGAAGTLVSLYIRDPDGNLIEVSNYI